MKRLNNYIKIIVLVVVLSSCGARKVIRIESKEAAKAEFSDQSKSEQTEQSQTKGEINVKKSEEVTVDNQNQTLTKKETIEPVDPTKPASYTDKDGKKQELNNSKKTIETRTQINNTKTESKVKTETLEKKESKTNKKKYENKNIKAKTTNEKLAQENHVDREAWSVFNFLWLLVPAAVLYYVWRNRVAIGKKI